MSIRSVGENGMRGVFAARLKVPSLSLCPSQKLRFVEEAFVLGGQTELPSYKSGQADANTGVNRGQLMRTQFDHSKGLLDGRGGPGRSSGIVQDN